VEPLKAGRTKLTEAEKVKPVDLKCVEAAINVLPPVVADMVRLQLLTAARPSEICAITPAMVDRSGEIWEVNFAKHKTAWRGKLRTIYVGKSGQAILSKYLDRGPDVVCFSPRDAMEQRLAKRAAERVTPKNQGNSRGYTARARKGIDAYKVAESYTTATYGRAIKHACKKAGISHWAPNQLRHTRSTEIRKAHGLEASQVILGHSKCDVTQIYAEANRELAIEVAKKSG
jgi:integrase